MKFLMFSPAKWRAGMLTVLARFPLAILSGVVVAGALIIASHQSSNEVPLTNACYRLAMAAAAGFPLFFSLRIWRERSRLGSWLFELPGLLGIAAIWYFVLPERITDAPNIVTIRWLLLLASLHFLSAVAAYFGDRGAGFWQFNRRIFQRFFLAVLYSGVLTVGLELALLSADKLFDLKLQHAYGDLFFVMAFVFHPAFFLAGVPQDFAALEVDPEYPRGLKTFTQYALAPLVAVYTALLYAYAVKIVIARSWPHGWVAMPVLILSGIGILAALLLHPLCGRAEEKWATWFGRNFPRALAPLTILLLLSLRMRVSDYGITEERYLGVVAGFWIFGWAIFFILRPQGGIRWVPSSLAIIAFLVAFGPWSAGAISKTSQVRRLELQLAQHGLWTDGHVVIPNNPVNLSTKESQSLREDLNYLVRTHGTATLAKIFPADWLASNNWETPQKIISKLRIAGEIDQTLNFLRKMSEPVNVQGFRSVWDVEQYSNRYENWRPFQCGDVQVGLDHGVLKMAGVQNKTPLPIPMDAILQRLRSVPANQLSAQELSADFQRDNQSYRIVFIHLNYEKDSKTVYVMGSHFLLLEK